MIASIEFRDFRVLEHATLPLGAFNLLLGPNGSGKTTALRALLALGQIARDRLHGATSDAQPDLAGASTVFTMGGAFEGVSVRLGFGADGSPAMEVIGGVSREDELVQWLSGLRGYVIDPLVLAKSVDDFTARSIGWNGEGLAGVLASMHAGDAGRWRRLVGEFQRLMPEFSDIVAGRAVQGGVSFSVVTRQGKALSPENLSQGTLVLLGVLALVFGEDRPSLFCLEELERGLHPRLLREMRDLLFRMSFPEESGETTPAVQVVATTHSPYVLDLFADTPEDVIVATKGEGAATFQRLDAIPELSEMLESGRLGDLWYSGILGGVP
ncbi:MAG: AAA family ATPase [Opitutaceae bacterium]